MSVAPCSSHVKHATVIYEWMCVPFEAFGLICNVPSRHSYPLFTYCTFLPGLVVSPQDHQCDVRLVGAPVLSCLARRGLTRAVNFDVRVGWGAS